MKKVLKFLLIVFIWLIVSGLCVAGVILFDLPVTQGLWIFAGIFVTWYFTKFIIYLYRRWRAKQRVEKLINVDSGDDQKKKLSLIQFFAQKDIDKYLTRVINRINQSDLGKFNHSTNSLTWAIHLKIDNNHGQWLHCETINKPKLNDPLFNEFNHIEWIVYNQFMMLDVDAYLMKENNPSAKNAWLQLLNGLSYSKKSKSLDSLVVSIHIDDLSSEQRLQQISDLIRTKYEDIKEYCGIELSISIVLIGLDELNGVDTWLDNLGDEWKSKVLGCVNTNNANANIMVKQCFEELHKIFNQGSLSYLISNGFNVNAANLPGKAKQFETALSALFERMFYSSQFQCSPKCAGLFLVMKSQGSQIFVNSLLESSALCWLPAEFTNHKTISDIEKRKKKLVYVAASTALSVLLFIIHDVNKDNIENIFKGYQQELSGSTKQQQLVDNLTSRYDLVQNLSGVNLAHWLPSKNDPLNIPIIRSQLINDINEILIAPIDQGFDEKLKSFDSSDLDTKIDYLNILIRRINLLKAASKASILENLNNLPQPYDQSYIDTIPVESLQAINQIYTKSLELKQQSSKDGYRINWQKDINIYESKLSAILLASDGDMQWLVDWVNQNSSIKDIKLKDYWHGTKNTEIKLQVDRAYTVSGKLIIDSFIEQLRLALGSQSTFLREYLPLFKLQYERNYLSSWGAFLKGFNLGQSSLSNREQWLNVINDLTTGRNIFFKLLNDADYQLSEFKNMDVRPDWYEFVVYYQDMLALGQDKVQGNKKKNKVLTKLALKMIGATGALGKAVATSGKSTLKTKKKIDKASGSGPGPSEREINLQEAANNLDNYKKTLSDMVFSIEQRAESYNNIKGLFEFYENPTGAGTLLATSQTSIKKLQGLIGKAGSSTASFWNVYTGSTNILENFMVQESACHTNKDWKDDYLFELDGVPLYKLDTFAYGEAGVLWTFVEDKLKPFITPKKGGGYSFKRISDKHLPLSSELLNYLTRAKDLSNKQKFESFDLDITAKPTNLNKNSILYVSKTELAIQCSDGEQVLTNNNYINSKKFNWDASCGPVNIRFTIGNKVVEKNYPGEMGLLKFLKDFKTSKKRFEMEEFPQHFYVLNQFNIRYLDVNFEIEGGLKLMHSLDQKPPTPPSNIATCWESI